jgi:hypothetical protein
MEPQASPGPYSFAGHWPAKAHSPDEVWPGEAWPIQIVTHDRVPNRAQVHPNLMSSPRQRAHLKHCHFVESFEHAELRDRRLSRSDYPHALAVRGVAPDGAFDPPFVFGDAPVYYSEIDLLDLAILELLDELQIR